MPQPINLPPETTRKCVAGRIIHVGEWVMNWKGSRKCAALSVALWDGCGACRKRRSIALWSSLVLERWVSTPDSTVGFVDTFTGTAHHGGRKLGFSISERRWGNLSAQPSVPPLLLYVLCCSLRIFLHEIHQKGTFPFQSLAKKTGPAVVATLIKPCNSNWLWNCSFLACVSCSSIVSPLFLMISFFKAPPTHACAFLTDVPFV